METRINIAEILRNKPSGIRLYSPIFGNCTYCYIHDETSDICVKRQHNVMIYFNFEGLYNTAGECLLFPSKEMRDWSKFAWKKGDVLTNSSGFQIFFDKWANEDYTKFLGKIKVLGNSHCYDTANYSLASKEEALEFIKSVEEINNGKLNLETLRIEKSEFKDGDIVCISGMGYLAYSIVKSIDNSSKKLEYYVLNDMSTLKFEDWLSFEDKQIQPITETQQIILFDALARENKAWDAEKIQIVDLKPKVKLKPFDKVIVRCSKADKWSIDFKAGARWATNEFLKDLWHPASEIPCEGKYLVVEYNVTDTIKDYLSFKRLEGYLGWNWIPYCKSANVTQWLYIDDLLPKKGD